MLKLRQLLNVLFVFRDLDNRIRNINIVNVFIVDKKHIIQN